MPDPIGINIGDPATLRPMVERLVAILDRDWVNSLVTTLNRSATARAGGDRARLLLPLAMHVDLLSDLEAGRTPTDPNVLLKLGFLAYIVSRCAAFPGGDRFVDKLRTQAHAETFKQFFDTLFEGEAAVYWSDQMGSTSVEFPDAHNPDFLATITIAGHQFQFANECKRIAPQDQREVDQDGLGARLEQAVRDLHSIVGGMKVIVWTHVTTDQLDESALLEVLERLMHLAATSPSDPRWIAESAGDGTFQVSVSAAGEAGEFHARSIQVTDVPDVGPLRVSMETVHVANPPGPTRLKYIVSLRSDAVPNRVGNLEQRVGKAIEQLLGSGNGASGAINIRIRPPRGIGDLLEADQLVRKKLRSPAAARIGLVTLFWNEGERDESDLSKELGEPARQVTSKSHLRAHFISNVPNPIDFSTIDSYAARFAGAQPPFIRDPETGSLMPVDPALFELIENASPVPNGAAESSVAQATVYIALTIPFPENVTRTIVQPVKTAHRTFVPWFDDQQHIRFIEFVDRKPIRVATIDLRAWSGATELLFWLDWSNEAWTVRIPSRDETSVVTVRSSAVRGAIYSAA